MVGVAHRESKEKDYDKASRVSSVEEAVLDASCR